MKAGELEFDLNHFFRYVYSGFILCLSIVVIIPDQSMSFYNSLGGKDLAGSVFFIFFIIAVGVGFYALYKELISEWIISGFHFHVLKLLKLHLETDCVFKYLEKLKVKKEHSLTAFRLIRDNNFNPEIRKIFYLRHSEVHVLDLTFTACIIGVLTKLVCFFSNISTYGNWVPAIILLCVAIVTLIAGLRADKNICADECYYCKLIKDKITPTLEVAELILQTHNEIKAK